MARCNADDVPWPLDGLRAGRYAISMKEDDKDGSQQSSATARLRDRLRKLCHGRTPAAFRFQLAAIIIDLAIIAFFVATPVL